MLTQLLQWFNKFSNHPVGNKSSSLKAARGLEVAQPPPELTNADLEVLFTQLLGGVQQGRGKQWAIQYLERMENRISVERWIDWLLIFGEKLLLSPAPNHQLATQMMELGELGIGKVGELAYDIGIRLLTGELGEEYEEYEVYEESETTTSQILDHPLDSPKPKLIPNLGESLWESEDESPELEITAAKPQIDFSSEILTENTAELIWESPEAEETTAPSLITPPKNDVTANFRELLGESDKEKAQSIKSEPKAAIEFSSGNGDQSLANLEPNVGYTGDESLVRLDDSPNLVPPLAANLSRTNQIAAITADQPPVKGQDWFYQGLQQAKTGDLVGAIASYNQAIEMNPDAYEYWFNRGLTLFHLEDFAQAIASYDQAIELKPHHYKSWYNRGCIFGELGEFEEAIASFNQAIVIEPQQPEAFAQKGLALLKLGQISEAISNYDQALHLEPEDPENWYYRGIGLAVSEQYTEAIASYDQAILIQPDFPEVWIDRGVVLFNLGNWSQAIASWDQALATQPDLYLAWYNRGIALENLGNREEAIASYENAIAIKPDFHLAWYNQAVALYHLERFAQAIVSYDNALQIKLDYWEAWIGRGTAASHLITPTPLNSLTTITTQNPALQQGGHEGKLASYEEGLKHIRPDTHPEGWGRLHIAKGNTYYDLGKKSPTARNYWHQAIAEYDQALLTLTTEDFTELHLEVLQSLIKTLLGIGQIAEAQQLQQQAADLLAQLLTESTRSDQSKKQLALKFAGIGQLEVDLAIEYGDLVEAWEMAEQGKNSCLTWLLSDWNEQIYSHYYNSVQQLLNPHTAIIYWHISPVALHTFIIKDQAPSPILVFTPIQDIVTIDLEENAQLAHELPLPEAVRRLIEFEDWLEDWHQQYQEYLSQAQDQHSKSNHPWRVDMAEKLLQLQNILQISTITQELEDITQLILIPHRDLHRLPLHTLFNISSPSFEEPPTHLTISYLPSVEKGLSVQPESLWQFPHQMLLSIEYPNSTNSSPLKFAKLESEIISQMFNNPQRIQGDNATKNEVVNALFDNRNSIFHFAGSVTKNDTDPKKSALALVDENQITLEEISQINLNSYKLVILSASEIATNKNQNITTEYVDLANGFICGGVPHVVSTLWTVESSASTLVMIEFYRRLQLNKSPVIALAEATAWLKELTALELTKWYEDLLNNLDPDELKIKAYLATYLYRSSKMVPDKKLYSHPYYWAAYTIKGIVP
ncbi:CHAT domain-containing protein [Nodularia sphaerocarpa]|uniref:CHAT domain-containing protein n=1 Tax=Nodularia sphaerocarpa TaxID=137816 RepID=UPI001EFBF00F|nr:tetratricopeptide repeat protein [Nodularia sphaerocarpa]MDB9374214.1 tetratricopeptide repeat protein [Nodularia sphaerocarpa CS-585]MDB9377763.1 tetratricopeptide repeat protein [Nodularia sphaerocarpa CS-585A2]ULP74848.1 TPR repeat-containing protein YrrB [Nodularia sphaerocarpa UHCC 0038]